MHGFEKDFVVPTNQTGTSRKGVVDGVALEDTFGSLTKKHLYQR